MFLVTLALPTLLLMVLAVVAPRMMESVVSESIGGMIANLALSSVLLWVLSAAVFAGLYLVQDGNVARLLGAPEGIAHFMQLGFKAALIWAPLVALVVWTSPGRWTKAVW